MHTVLKVISSKQRCQKVPLSVRYMFVIDHKEKVFLINYKSQKRVKLITKKCQEIPYSIIVRTTLSD